MKKITTLVILFAMAVAFTGCAKKTASEQLREDMKAANKELEREAAAWK